MRCLTSMMKDSRHGDTNRDSREHSTCKETSRDLAGPCRLLVRFAEVTVSIGR